MIKDWKDLDLSTATIFDLTDDMELIRKAEDCSDEEDDPNPGTYEAEYSRVHVIDTMIAFTEITNNKDLYHAILKANSDYDIPPCCIPGISIFD